MKLFKILHLLSTRELTKFRQYLETPIFNKRSDVQRLLDQWIKEKKRSHPARYYWSKVHPKEAFTDKKWGLLCSRLFKLLESYLAFLQIQKEEPLQKIYLAKAYRHLQQEKFFSDATRDSQLALDKQPYRSTKYLQDSYNLSYEKYDYISSSSRKSKHELQEVIDHLDTYLVVAKLKQACNARSRSLINQEQYDIGLIAEILEYIENINPNLLEVPAIAIYYYCYQAIQKRDNEQAFLQLREAIRAHQHLFPPTEMRDIYTFAINFSIRQSNKGSTFFIKETFELYRLSLEQGFLLEDGVILESTYSNIVSLALKLEQYNWAAEFLEKYRVHLKPRLRSSFYFFNLGKLYYQQGKLEESLQQLVHVENVASFLYLAARVLQLKIYYELQELDPLESLLDSLRVYLQRSKDLAYRKVHYSNIITFTKLLLQMSAMSKTEKLAFKRQVEEAETFGEKDWFLEKIE